MACRDTIKAEEAKNDIIESCKGSSNLGALIVKKLDLGSIKSIKKFAEEVLLEEKKINLLINNAGKFIKALLPSRVFCFVGPRNSCQN